MWLKVAQTLVPVVTIGLTVLVGYFESRASQAELDQSRERIAIQAVFAGLSDLRPCPPCHPDHENPECVCECVCE